MYRGITVDWDGTVVFHYDDRAEVFTSELDFPFERFHNEQGERLYTTPIAELSVFNVSPQRVPHELPRRDAGS